MSVVRRLVVGEAGSQVSEWGEPGAMVCPACPRGCPLANPLVSWAVSEGAGLWGLLQPEGCGSLWS